MISYDPHICRVSSFKTKDDTLYLFIIYIIRRTIHIMRRFNLFLFFYFFSSNGGDSDINKNRPNGGGGVA